MSQILPTSSHRDLIVLAFAFLNKVLSFENAFSMGLRSGEYRGRYKTHAPLASIASMARLFLWTLRLSQITTSSGLSVGTSCV